MIKIKNPQEIKKYFKIPDEAVAFLESVTENTENKKYVFSDDCFINVQNCLTKTECIGMEAHEKYVDIQCLVKGEEKIYYKNREGLTVTKPRSENGDTTIYAFPEGADFVCYCGGEGIILYTDEAHAPNKAVNEPMETKKVVVKINKSLAI